MSRAVMKPEAVIFDLKRYAIHDGPGIRTTVFFKGCPMSCWWCQNPEGINVETETMLLTGKRERDVFEQGARESVIGRLVDVRSLMDEIEKDRIFYEQSGGGVTASGGEPMAQPEFLLEFLRVCKESGLDTAVDTSGYAPSEDFERVTEFVDLYLYDIKIMDKELHCKYTGVENDLVLRNLKLLSEAGCEIMPRIPLIPGITDTGWNLDAIAQFLVELERIETVCLLPYNRICEDKLSRFGITSRLGRLPDQSDEDVENCGRILERYGFEVRYGG